MLLADSAFVDTKRNKLHKAQFLAKDYKQLIVNKLLKFNSRLIQLTLDKIILIQEQQYTNLSIISKNAITSTSSKGVIYTLLILKDQYIVQHIRETYITSVCQLKALFDLSFTA